MVNVPPVPLFLLTAPASSPSSTPEALRPRGLSPAHSFRLGSHVPGPSLSPSVSAVDRGGWHAAVQSVPESDTTEHLNTNDRSRVYPLLSRLAPLENGNPLPRSCLQNPTEEPGSRSPWGLKESDPTERLRTHITSRTQIVSCHGTWKHFQLAFFLTLFVLLMHFTQ